MSEGKRWIESEVLFTAIKEQLKEGREASFAVTGMSMWPLLCHGRDSVIVGSCDVKTLKKGDIVLFQTPEGKYLLHRITKLEPDYFQTTGDGNLIRDGYYPYECIFARVNSFIRKGKKKSPDSFVWRFEGRLWMGLYPIRSLVFRIIGHP